MINVRAERVADSPAYARAFARRRCLIPADGWYEWRRRKPASAAGGRAESARTAGRQVYFMTPRDGTVLAFAGLWAVWGSGTDRLITCSVVTTAAVGEFAFVHDRMPLCLPPWRWPRWLPDGGGSADEVDPAELLAPPEGNFLASLEIRPVGPAVGDVRNDGPELIKLASSDDQDVASAAATDQKPTDPTLF
jgi:putative SOS response-associated peptidase YedK